MNKGLHRCNPLNLLVPEKRLELPTFALRMRGGAP